MKHSFVLAAIVLTSCYSFAQPPFYVQNGNSITKVENDPSQLNVKEWQVRLYKNGDPKSGNNYWSTIKGSSADEVMQKLKTEQDFELKFNDFIGKGRVQDVSLTHFNALGPIAVIDAPKASEFPLTEEQKKAADLYDKAVDIFFTGKELNNNLKAILPDMEENRYGDIGSNFVEYSSNIKDAVQQIMIVQNLLSNHTTNSFENINKKIDEIDEKLNYAKTKLNEITTSLNNSKRTQDAIEETLQKELAKKDTKPKINLTQHETSYFIFLTVDISMPPKQSLFSNLQTPIHLHIISKSIWYTREQTDENSIKEAFLQEIEKQVKNLDIDFHKNFSRNNYELVGYINTNFKESIPLLNNQQCQEALVNYKNLILNIDKVAEFMQLQ